MLPPDKISDKPDYRMTPFSISAAYYNRYVDTVYDPVYPSRYYDSAYYRSRYYSPVYDRYSVYSPITA
jgi:hypothetical protein